RNQRKRRASGTAAHNRRVPRRSAPRPGMRHEEHHVGFKTAASLTKADEASTLKAWTSSQLNETGGRDLLSEAEIREQSKGFLLTFPAAAAHSFDEELAGPRWDDVRAGLTSLSRSRATSGFSPAETASFVFSLKQPLFEAVRKAA